MSDLMPMPVSADIAMNQLKHTGKLDGKLEKSAKEFEAMFMSQMASLMFEGVKTDPMFGGGHGEEMFKSLLTQEYGKMMAEGNGSAVSGQIQKMMLKIQEQQG